METSTCYKPPMGKRAIKEEDKKNEVLSVSVSMKTRLAVEALAEEHERSMSYIGGSLLQRGLEAYRRDGLLKEPNNGNGDSRGGIPFSDSVLKEVERRAKKMPAKKRKEG